MVMLKTGPTGDYREHLLRHPATYTGPESADFNQNAVQSANPMNPTRTRTAAYGTQQTVGDWNTQLRQLFKEV